MPGRYAYRKRDANEPDIVNALTRRGYTVQKINEDDFFDLIVSKDGETWCIEVKLPGKHLRPNQRKLYDRWPGKKGIAHSIAEALTIVGETSR